MAITVYSDVVLSSAILGVGIKGKNQRVNSRVMTDNGFESVNVIWTQTLHEYTLGVVPMALSTWQSVETIHEVTEGGAYGFLLLDPHDSSTSDGVCTGLTSTTFQLYKRYLHAPSGRFKNRKITRPIAAGFAITNSGVTVASYTLNATTGVITIPAAPTAANLAWTGSFYVPVHFQDDSIDWDLVRSGNAQDRLIAGPAVVLKEIRE
jgi:uncharacterized protein (TIGR02217 family)